MAMYTKQAAAVFVELQLGDNIYTIKREIDRNKGTGKCEFRKNGELIGGPDTKRTTEAIEKELQIDYELFSRAIYSEQNKMEHFLDIPSGQRKKKIDELLRIDRYEKARKTLVSVINRLKDRRNDKRKDLEKINLEELENKQVVVSEEISKLQEETTNLISESEVLNKEVKQLDEKVSWLEEKANKKAGKIKVTHYKASTRDAHP